MCERTDGSVPRAPCPVLLLRRHQPGSLVVNMTGSAARLGGSPGPVFVFRIKQGWPIGQFVLVLWGLFVAVVGYIGGLSRFDSTSWLDISCWF